MLGITIRTAIIIPLNTKFWHYILCDNSIIRHSTEVAIQCLQLHNIINKYIIRKYIIIFVMLFTEKYRETLELRPPICQGQKMVLILGRFEFRNKNSTGVYMLEPPISSLNCGVV